MALETAAVAQQISVVAIFLVSCTPAPHAADTQCVALL